MKKIIFITILALITSVSGFSQNVNSYKYVIVPNQFEFLKGSDQYQLNSLTKFLFEKYGFEVFLDNEKLPTDLANNRCKALTAFVTEESGLFTTKLNVGLKDCNNNELFLSEVGESRTKEYKQAYHEALREAFKSVAGLNYHYNNTQNDVTAAKKEERNVPQKQEASQAEMPAAVAEVVAVPIVENKQKSEIKVEEKVVAEDPSNSKETLAVSKSSEMIFTNNEASFYLKKSDKGFNFFQNGMTEPFAALIATNKENSYIYSSITSQGVAYFQQNGDLVVETLDSSTNTTNTKIFKLKD